MAFVVEGQKAQALDIYLRFNNVLADPTAITYNIIEPSGSFVASGAAPFKRSTGVYDARTTTIPSGFTLTECWQIVWNFTSPDSVQSTATQEFSVVESAPVNVNDLLEQVKLDLNLGTTYTNAQIHIFIKKALNRLSRKLARCGVPTMTFSTSTGLITPSPSNALFDIILLQVECIIAKTNRATAIKSGIRVRDGDSEIDTVAGLTSHGQHIESVCSELNDAIADFCMNQGRSGQHGELVGYFNQEIVISHDHSNQSDFERSYQSPFDED